MVNFEHALVESNDLIEAVFVRPIWDDAEQKVLVLADDAIALGAPGHLSVEPEYVVVLGFADGESRALIITQLVESAGGEVALRANVDLFELGAVNELAAQGLHRWEFEEALDLSVGGHHSQDPRHMVDVVFAGE